MQRLNESYQIPHSEDAAGETSLPIAPKINELQIPNSDSVKEVENQSNRIDSLSNIPVGDLKQTKKNDISRSSGLMSEAELEVAESVKRTNECLVNPLQKRIRLPLE